MSRLDIVKEQIGLHWSAIGDLIREQRVLMQVTDEEANDASSMLEECRTDMSHFDFVGEQFFEWSMLDEIEAMRMCDVCDTNPADPAVQESHGHVCLDCARHGRTSL